MQHVHLNNGNITLRELTLDDAEAVFAYASDPEVNKFMTWPRAEKVGDTHEFLDQTIENAKTEPRTEYGLAVVLDGELVGSCGLHNVSEMHKSAEMGYCLRRDVWGRGVMTEAARMLVRFAFEDLGLKRIQATHDPENRASGRVMEKIGMAYEGLLHSHLAIHGRRRDSVLRAIIAEDSGPPSEAQDA